METPSPAREHAHAIASAVCDYMATADADSIVAGTKFAAEAYETMVNRIEAALDWAKDCAAVVKRNAF